MYFPYFVGIRQKNNCFVKGWLHVISAEIQFGLIFEMTSSTNLDTVYFLNKEMTGIAFVYFSSLTLISYMLIFRNIIVEIYASTDVHMYLLKYTLVRFKTPIKRKT